MSDLPRLHTVLPHHVEELVRSGLSVETIVAAGLYGASASCVAGLLGFGSGSGLVFPYPVNGSDGAAYARVKLDKPGPDGKRYRSPKGRGNHLYIPPASLLDPAVLADPSTPLYVTEGEKKALKGCQEGSLASGDSLVFRAEDLIHAGCSAGPTKPGRAA